VPYEDGKAAKPSRAAISIVALTTMSSVSWGCMALPHDECAHQPPLHGIDALTARRHVGQNRVGVDRLPIGEQLDNVSAF